MSKQIYHYLFFCGDQTCLMLGCLRNMFDNLGSSCIHISRWFIQSRAHLKKSVFEMTTTGIRKPYYGKHIRIKSLQLIWESYIYIYIHVTINVFGFPILETLKKKNATKTTVSFKTKARNEFIFFAKSWTYWIVPYQGAWMPPGIPTSPSLNSKGSWVFQDGFSGMVFRAVWFFSASCHGNFQGVFVWWQ